MSFHLASYASLHFFYLRIFLGSINKDQGFLLIKFMSTVCYCTTRLCVGAGDMQISKLRS